MLIIKNIHELATCRSPGNKSAVGKDFLDCGIVKNAAVIIDGENILDVGGTKKILLKYKPSKKDTVIDASGKIGIPGFVDCHTHAVFAGSRAEEYQLKLKGESYEALHKKKGGIHLTVSATRKASENDLFLQAKKVLHEMLVRGTTTVEIKSGYGLNMKDELKILRVIKRLRKSVSQDIVSTFLGAHTVPLEYKNKRSLYIKKIIEEMMPRVKKENLAEYCDIFCDPLGFSPEETRSIFNKARALGFKLRIHAEQTSHFGGARIGAEYNVASVDHCDFLSSNDIKMLKKSGASAVFLPGVFFHLMEFGKQRRLQEIVKRVKNSKVPLVLATDYNPGSSPILSMKIIMDLALRFFKLDYLESLNAATINAAKALGRSDTLGSIEKGKQADILIIDSPTVKDYLHAPGDRRIDYVVKKGNIKIKNTVK